MPDGPYYLKIVASDLPSNPPSFALSSERPSDRFEIENASPRIENLRAESKPGGAQVTFDGISSSVSIDHARYSVDAGDWQVVFPRRTALRCAQGKLFIFTLRPAAGEHTVAVQIADRFDNSAAAKMNFTVSASAPK